MKLSSKIFKKCIEILLTLLVLFSSFIPLFNPIDIVKTVEANACTAPSVSSSYGRVGGVALDQAATFLAEMDDLTGAYYDEELDRIVFVGKKNTTLPEFDKDDLAVAIKAVLFRKELPAVSIEDSTDPDMMDVIYYGGIENTRFGDIMFEADYRLKQYVIGFDENDNPISSGVSGYKPVVQRYLDKNPDPGLSNAGRQWIVPDEITLKKDDTADSFVFDTVTMELNYEPLSVENDPLYDEASEEFAAHHTTHFDDFAEEIPSYEDTKQLAKIVGVIKWLTDNGIASDFSWAHDYEPEYVDTPEQIDQLETYVANYNGYSYTATGGVEYTKPNSYIADDGEASDLKTASEAVETPKEEIHWTFIEDSQQYEAVAVAADAFRSLGSYNTSVTDMSFPTSGDLNLEFVRSYSSYSGGQFGIGRGWSFIPAKLVDNKPIVTGILAAYCTGETFLKRSRLAFDSNGHRETFLYDDVDEFSCGYLSDDPSFHSSITPNAPSETLTTYDVKTKDQITYTFEDLVNVEYLTNYNLRLKSISDDSGSKINYNYESSTSGKLVSISDDYNHEISMNYSTTSANLISSISDWNGRTISYGYDSQGNLISVTDPEGNITEYEYDANNKLITIEDKEDNIVISNLYTPEAKISEQTDASGLTKFYSYDEDSRIITATDSASSSRETSIKYDEKARVLEDIDPYGNKYVYTYATESAPLTITDKNNNTTTNTYDQNGNLESTTFPNTKSIEYEYDDGNRIISITDNRYSSPKISTFTYDSNGNLLIATESGKTTIYTYNNDGEMLSSTNPLGKTSAWTRNNLGKILTEEDPLSNTTAYNYDVLGRLLRSVDSENKTNYFTYDENGNVLISSNSAGLTTTYLYDSEGRLVKTTLPDNSEYDYAYNTAGSLISVTDPAEEATNYDYNSYQDLTSLEDALDKTTLYEYDKLSRKTKRTTPLGKALEWEYDNNGNITKRIDGNNDETDYEYDNMNQLELITYPDDSEVNFNYDDRGNLISVVSDAGTSSYQYDEYDRLTQFTDPNSEVVSYQYDNNDNLTRITYPGSKEVNYVYDDAGRLVTVTDWNDDDTTYEYFDNGKLKKRILPNGVVSSYTYDNSNMLINLAHEKGSDILAEFAYERDLLGNIISATESGNIANITSGISDDWVSGAIDTSKWNIWNPSQTSVISERIVFDSTLSSGYYGIDSAVGGRTFNLTDSSITNQLVEAGNQSLTSLEVYPLIAIKKDDSSNDQLLFKVSGNDISAIKIVDGSGITIDSETYSPSAHRFFRIREENGITYWDVSGNGVSWSNFTSTPTPFTVTATIVGMQIGTWQAESSTTSVIFDNFNKNESTTPTLAIRESWSNGINDVIWNNWGGSQVDVVNNQLRIDSMAEGGYFGIDSGPDDLHQDLEGSFVTNQLIDAGNQTITSWEVYPIIISKIGSEENNQLSFMVSNGNLIARKLVSGSNTNISSDTYNPSTQKFFRIRESNGTVYYDTSADGDSWSNFTSTATPFDVDEVNLGMLVGTWQAEAGTTSAIFDNLNISLPMQTSTVADSWSNSSIDTDVWNIWNESQTDIVEGKIVLESTTSSGYYGIDSGANDILKNLTRSYVTNELVGAGNQSLSSFEVYPILIQKDADNKLIFFVSNNTVYAAKIVSGVFSSISSAPYNSSLHKYFRIREREDTIYYDISQDGKSWSNFTSTSTPFDVSKVEVGMTIGTWSAEASVTSATFDNFNVVSPYTTDATQYSYDVLSRLLSKSSDKYGEFSYTYNDVGSMVSSILQENSTSYILNNDNQITQAGLISFEYDNNGNQTSRGSTSLEFDYDNMLMSFTATGTSSVNFIYDGSKNRITEKLDTTTTKKFVNDVSGELTLVLIERDVQSSTDNYFLYGHGPVSQGGVTDVNREYYLDDGVGNIRAIVDADGDVSELYKYDPYGNLIEGSDDAGFSFKAENFDESTSLYYMRARYYDPTTGTFISRDPVDGVLENPLSQNGYSYAHDNPINLADPSGEAVPAVVGACILAACRDGDCTNEARAAHLVAGKIAGYTKHGIDQVISRDGGKGVSPQAILNAVKAPEKILYKVDKVGQESLQYIGEKATVVLNKAGEVVSAWGQPR